MLSNKNILITGASGSIGSSLLKALLANEAHNKIYCASSSSSKIDSLIASLLPHCSSNLLYSGSFDLASIEGVNQLVFDVRRQIGYVDVLINSAGVFPQCPLESISHEQLLSTFYINLFSSILLSQEFSDDMVARKWGRIVNIGSSSCYIASRNTCLYSSTKHGLLGFSKSLHDELKSHGVRVSCISPSSTQGQMGRSTIGQDYSTFLDPDDIASFVLHTISYDGNMVVEDVLLRRTDYS